MPAQLQVVIVEDDPPVRRLIEGVVEDCGYLVVGRAADGRRAVELTATLQPDVVLMDVAMPIMDGLAAAEAIQRTCPTPVVILTAYDTPDLAESAARAGAGGYLVKPPTARDLERAITIARARFKDLVELRRLNAQLQDALNRVKALQGLLPICASCKRIRDDRGYWHQVDDYMREHGDMEFTHAYCPDCLTRLYSDGGSGAGPGA
jgi:AmiR/NasT family two-component response regulator